MHVTQFTRALAIAAGATLTTAGLVATGGSAHAAATLVVGNPATCAASQYRTINDAVAAASPSDTIQVCAGSYGEQVVVDKAGLTFRGAQAGIDGRKKLGRKTSQTIVANSLKATGSGGTIAINLRNYGGGAASVGTTVTGNTVSGWANNLRIDDGSQGVYAAGNTLSNAGNDGILVGSSTSGAYLARNRVTGATTYSCQDQSTGAGTSGTANTWRRNTSSGTASTPVGIC